MLINRSDRLGLAELYQLRGRVGRSHQRAYAYLLVPPETTLSDIARKRLAAMTRIQRTRRRLSNRRFSTSSFAALATCSAASNTATSKPSASTLLPNVGAGGFQA